MLVFSSYRLTLNAKLLGFALLLVFFTVVVATVSFVRGRALKTKNDIQLLYVDLLKAHTNAKLFIRTRQIEEMREFKESNKRFTSILQDYRDEGYATDMLLGMQRFNSTFEQIFIKMKERGLDENLGSEGLFRRNIHELQHLIEIENKEQLNLILLEARRREKDYFLRGDTSYASFVRNSILQLLQNVTASGLRIATQQKIQRLALGYLQEFEHTVRIMQEIAILEQGLEKEFETIEPVIRRVETLKQRESSDQEAQMLVVTIISLIVSIVTAFTLARRISSPIVELQRASQRLAEGDYSVTVETRSKDEIADLGKAFNSMITNVRERTEQLNTSYNSLRILSGIGRDISSTLQYKSIFTMLYKNIAQLVDANIFAIGVLDEQEQIIQDFFTVKNGNQLPLFSTPMSNKNSFAVWALEHRSEVFINDNAKEYTRYVNGMFIPSEIFLPQEFPQSLMFIPLLVGDTAIGVLTVQSFQRNAYTLYHLDIVRTLAAYTAAALNNAKAFATVQEQNSEILRQQELLEEQAATIQITNTELQERNVQLEELNQEKNEFLGIAAHDLKNPLAAIQMAASIIQNYYDKLDKETVIERTTSIMVSSKRMSEIITNLLDINAIETGNLNLHIKEIDIVALSSQIIDEYYERAMEKKIIMFPEFTLDSLLIKADLNAMTQVLDNILSNAIKYSPSGKRVFIRVRSLAATVRVEVQDEGQGMSDDDMKKLFGKFARLSARPTGGEHSTGLGLSIVKKMVEAMNGKVWCESELGKGATFIVELPKNSS
ncbi:MAG: HAMP domain-containing protein [Candidatus Kapaibacterium sp.]|nr:MAG: HAMP domain-containing protein [Candidatus Kapabacteria bacterium]